MFFSFVSAFIPFAVSLYTPSPVRLLSFTARLLLPQPDSKAAIEVIAMAFIPYFFSAFTKAGARVSRFVPSRAFFKVFVLIFDGSNMFFVFIETVTYFAAVFCSFV